MTEERTGVYRAAKAVGGAPDWVKGVLLLSALGAGGAGGVSGVAALVQTTPAENRTYIARVDTARAELAGEVDRLKGEVADLENWMSTISGDVAYVICLLETNSQQACVRLRETQ